MSLKNRTVYFSKPKDFNDPFDCQLNIEPNDCDPSINRPENHYIKGFRNHVMNLGVFSLSRNKKSILMWSHYANKHKGVCLEFDTEKMSLDGKMFLTEIRYPKDNAYPKVTLSDIIKKDLDAVKKLLITKSRDWEYEEEQRIILNDKNRSGTSLPRPLSLTGVIFGDKMKDCYKKLVKKILEKEKIQYYDAIISKSEYKIEIQPCKHHILAVG